MACRPGSEIYFQRISPGPDRFVEVERTAAAIALTRCMTFRWGIRTSVAVIELTVIVIFVFGHDLMV